MADQDDKKPSKTPIEKLVEKIEGFLDDLKALLDPPRPVRVPVPVGPRRPR